MQVTLIPVCHLMPGTHEIYAGLEHVLLLHGGLWTVHGPALLEEQPVPPNVRVVMAMADSPWVLVWLMWLL